MKRQTNPGEALGEKGPFHWLHLSDFHFKARQRWDRRATLAALLRHVEEGKDRGLAPDFVFVSAALQEGQKAEGEEMFNQRCSLASARVGVESFVAGITTAEAPFMELLAYVHRRTLNAWLLQV